RPGRIRSDPECRFIAYAVYGSRIHGSFPLVVALVTHRVAFDAQYTGGKPGLVNRKNQVSGIFFGSRLYSLSTGNHTFCTRFAGGRGRGGVSCIHGATDLLFLYVLHSPCITPEWIPTVYGGLPAGCLRRCFGVGRQPVCCAMVADYQ